MLTISATMQPTDQMSIAEEYFCDPRRTSGGRYQSVTTSWVNPLTGMPEALASPKSASLRTFLFDISRFCGLRSLCRIFFS